MALGTLVLLSPVPGMLLVLAAWKLFTELLRPAAGELFWEVIERASNILAPLALLYVRGWPRSLSDWLWLTRTRRLNSIHARDIPLGRRLRSRAPIRNLMVLDQQSGTTQLPCVATEASRAPQSQTGQRMAKLDGSALHQAVNR